MFTRPSSTHKNAINEYPSMLHLKLLVTFTIRNKKQKKQKKKQNCVYRKQSDRYFPPPR